ncbi:MAG: hypothetical protein A2V65_11590 [Deltaproteobacteria bacterium RBG_13_49_15]|nr:MAG: hypothetical protein A2V65_11590 [Deltaproteobacteria bacterium RBG_13_49_15]
MVVKLELIGRAIKAERYIFKANQKITAMLTCCGLEPGRYEYDFHWINPQGRTKHRVLQELEVKKKMANHECRRLGVWLKISRGFFGFIDRHDFGEWKLKVADREGNTLVKTFLVIS